MLNSRFWNHYILWEGLKKDHFFDPSHKIVTNFFYRIIILWVTVDRSHRTELLVSMSFCAIFLQWFFHFWNVWNFPWPVFPKTVQTLRLASKTILDYLRRNGDENVPKMKESLCQKITKIVFLGFLNKPYYLSPILFQFKSLLCTISFI